MTEIFIGPHPGYIGQFTTNEAEGAWPNGTRVTKDRWEDGDHTPIGAEGVVHGSLGPVPTEMPLGLCTYFYFVEWDRMPKFVIGVSDIKLRTA